LKILRLLAIWHLKNICFSRDRNFQRRSLSSDMVPLCQIAGFGNWSRNATREGCRVGQIDKVRAVIHSPRRSDGTPASASVIARSECLEQLLEAFIDIADRDDIHQAAERLARVQEWIIREAEQAAADPIFAALRLAS
jgi:hypothetical protein